jgi:hypothetical protein
MPVRPEALFIGMERLGFSIRSADRRGYWAGADVRLVRIIVSAVFFMRPSSFPFLEAWRTG